MEVSGYLTNVNHDVGQIDFEADGGEIFKSLPIGFTGLAALSAKVEGLGPHVRARVKKAADGKVVAIGHKEKDQWYNLHH